MRSNKRWIRSCFCLLLATAPLFVARPASAVVVFNNGGPILGATNQPFTIVPYYYGSGWGALTSTTVMSTQLYLSNLASYMSGKYVPTGIKPFISQFGVVAGASVAAPAGNMSAAATKLDQTAIRNIITTAQGSTGTQHLPGYASNVLIAVLLAPGFIPCAVNTTTCQSPLVNDIPGGGYHRDIAANQFYMAVFMDSSFNAIGISHEVFEAATDPSIILHPAWENLSTAVEICDVDPLPIGGFSYNGAAIWGCFDNSQGGSQTTTGYDPPTAFDPVSFLYPMIYPLF